MALTLPGTVASPAPSLNLIPQDRTSNRGRNALISIGLSLAVIAAVIHELGGLDVHHLIRMVPTRPDFWLTFAAFYLLTPACDWMIFHRLWSLPGAGFFALLRKKVYNELLLGYLGEAYFYTWARRRGALTDAPFGGVKDVAILSAMAGNGVTVGLLAIMLPLVGTTSLGLDTRMLTLSLGVIVVISIAAMAFRKRVFTLSRPELWMITRVHLFRIFGTTFLNALLWRMVLPDVPLSWWLYLATLRLLVSRLPLVPNKDLLFAGVAVVMLGHEKDIGELMALMAGLILVAHLLLGTLLAARDLAQPEQTA